MNLLVSTPQQRVVVLEENARLDYSGPRDYIDYSVAIDGTVAVLEVQLDFVKVTDQFQLYAALFDPNGTFRGHVQCPGGPGPREQRFVISELTASPGCVAGAIVPGEWTVRIDLDRFRESGEFSLRVVLGAEGSGAEAVGAEGIGPEPIEPGGKPTDAARSPRTANAAMAADLPSASVWLKGELHSHSVHSDGQNSVGEILAEASRLDLDFFALSDHFTWSHWSELNAAASELEKPLVIVPSIEVTTHLGHANVHGLSAWPDVYVDGEGWNCSQLAESVHADGGLIGVNHPFSGQQAWRRSDIGWGEIDLLEVVNQGQDANNDAAIGLWDRVLAQGFDVTAVAGTDCHNIYDPEQALGQVFTFVRCTERSLSALIEGLRAGATVVSRGAHLDFRIRTASETAEIGGRLNAETESLKLEVEVEASVPSALYVMRDGLMWHQSDVEAGTHTITLDDPAPVSGAYRVELHRRSSDPRHWASAWRSHESFEALTGHIRVFTS